MKIVFCFLFSVFCKNPINHESSGMDRPGRYVSIFMIRGKPGSLAVLWV
jgi:hypothetical protein